MPSLLRTKEAKFIGMFVGGNVVVFCLLLSFSIGFVWSLKKDIAEQSAEIARNSILSGNYRETSDILQQLSDRYGISSEIVSNSGRTVLKIGKSSASHPDSLPLFEYKYSLFLDEQKKKPAAVILFAFAPYDVMFSFLILWIIFVVASVLLLLRYFNGIKISQELEILHTRNAAISRTTQSLAHDVRKPFSMFKMIIDAVDGEDDPIEAKQLLKESLPEVQQAMASVNGMISDVLEIGSESAPIA